MHEEHKKVNKQIIKLFCKIIYIFVTAIWLSHGQLWVIIEEVVSLTQCQSLTFYIFDPKVTGSLVTRLGPELSRVPSWVGTGNLLILTTMS